MAKDKDRKKKLYFGLLIIFLMVSSTIGFMYGGDSGVKKINGQKFVKVDGGWQLYIDEIESYWKFSYLPTELGFDPELLDFSGSELNVYSSNDLSKNYEERLKFVLLFRFSYGEIIKLLSNVSHRDSIFKQSFNGTWC